MPEDNKAEDITATWIDYQGRKYDLRAAYADIDYLKAQGLDVDEPWQAAITVAEWLHSNRRKVVEVGYYLANNKPQTRNSILPDLPSPEEFARLIVGGDALASLAKAIVASVFDFFSVKELRENALRLLNQIMDNPLILQDSNHSNSGESSTNSADNPASTPSPQDNSPTGN